MLIFAIFLSQFTLLLYNFLLTICLCVKDNIISTKFVRILMNHNRGCYCRTGAFKSSFFPRTIIEWNGLDLQIKNLFYPAFKKYFIDKFRQVPNSVFNVDNLIQIKLLTRLRLWLSHSKNDRFNYKFQNCKSWIVFVVLRVSQQLTSSCIAIFKFW